LFIFAITSNAYAQEQVNDTVNVPFQFSGKLCAMDDETGKYVCKWDPQANIVVENKTATPDNPGPELTEPELVIPADAPVQPVGRHLDMQAKNVDRFIASSKSLKLDKYSSASTKEYRALLDELATCSRGGQEAAGIQQKDRFVVSTTWVNPDEMFLESFRLTGDHAVLKKAIEECKAQHLILQPKVLGRQYLDIGRYFNETQPYHADMALTDKVYPEVKLTPRDYFDSLVNAKKALCENSLISSDTKQQYGCFPIPNIDVGGVVKTTNVPYHKYMEYKHRTFEPNVGVVIKEKGQGGDIANFVHQQGGYEKAMDAIKWQKHFDSTDPKEMAKSYDQ